MQWDAGILATRQLIGVILQNFIPHARNCHISTWLKCDISIMFLYPGCLKREKFGDLRTFKKDIALSY